MEARVRAGRWALALVAPLGLWSIAFAGCAATTPPARSASGVCKNPHPAVSRDGTPTTFVECENHVWHRAEKRDCASSVPRAGVTCSADVPGGAPASCKVDADCTAAPNGHCEPPAPMIAGNCACEYGCVRDADCGSGKFCDCQSPAGRCLPASCTTDADCKGALCVATLLAPCGENVLACQSPDDECASYEDCKEGACMLEGGRRHCKHVCI